jgi:pimeloyl-ACP methyl ester carboxylesterase
MMLASVLAIIMMGAPAAWADGPVAPAPVFEQIGTPHTFKGAPGVYELVFEARRGPSPFDRIALHRIMRGRTPPTHPQLVMFYLPGTNMNGQAAPDDPRYSLPLYLAMHGVDFWALDYRTHFIPSTTPQAEMAELKSWTNELFESDIDAAARFLRKATGRDRIFISGFSRGVNFAYLYAALHPEPVAGLVLFDGSVGRGRSGSPLPDVYATDVGGKHLTWEKRSVLLQLVIENPEAPAPISKYKDVTENLEHVVYDSGSFGGKGGLANPFGGFADATVLARVLLRYDRYWPIVQDYEDSFTPGLTRDLHNSKVPVLVFSSTNISRDWPERVASSASSTGSGDVTMKTLKGWGHLDVICGTHAENEVFAPTLEWLRRHRK